MKNLFSLLMCTLLLCSCGKEKAFDEKFTEALDTAVAIASVSEEVCNQTKNAWSTAIFDNLDPDGNYCSDFNDALRIIFERFDEKGIYDEIYGKVNELNELAKGLSDCPDSRKEAYNELVSFITDVNAFVKLATDPSGSLQSYNSEVRELDNSLSKQYDSFKIKYADILENGKKE